jgi:hypothetical protein
MHMLLLSQISQIIGEKNCVLGWIAISGELGLRSLKTGFDPSKRNLKYFRISQSVSKYEGFRKKNPKTIFSSDFFKHYFFK